VHMNSPKLIDLIIMVSRVFFPGKWLNDRVK